MDKRKPIVTPAAPRIAHQSQAIRCDHLLYVSGQTGRDPETGCLEQGLDAQTGRMLSNVEAILAAAACGKEHIVGVTLMFSDMKYFKRVDEIYAAWSPPREVVPLPARRAFASRHLPGEAMVQMELVATVA